MSWRDRLGGTITLLSPDGNEFEANWVGNQRTTAKKVGIFTFPKARGAEVQDLDVGGAQYPLTIYFEGENHDLVGISFNAACAENGLWGVDHPVYGFLSLQLIGWTEHAEPVTSANITKFDIEFIEPMPDNIPVTSQQVANDILAQADVVNGTALDQFELVTQDSFSEIAAIQDTVNAVTAAVTENLAPLYETVASVNTRVTSIKRSIQDLITQPYMDVMGLAGQIQNLIQLPALAVESTTARLSAYLGLEKSLKSIYPSGSGTGSPINIVDDPDTTTPDVLGASSSTAKVAFNVAATKELSMVANQVAIAQIAATSSGTVDTRAQAIEVAETVSDAFTEMTDNLDVVQETFITQDIDNQYFSQTNSFYATAIISALAVRYMLIASFDLKKEKRFILDRPSTPIFVTISEYGDLGTDDSNFDLFIKSNSLKALDILLLPAGREVVVYV